MSGERERHGLTADVLAAVNRARAERGAAPLDAGPSYFDQIGEDDLALLDRIADEVFEAVRTPRGTEVGDPAEGGHGGSLR